MKITGHSFQDLVGGLRPDERHGSAFQLLDPGVEGTFGVRDGAEGTAADHPTGDLREPAFDDVEPARIGRSGAGGSGGLPAATSPAIPLSIKRFRHFVTVYSQIASHCATSLFDVPSADSGMIRVRKATACAVVWYRANDSKAFRSSSVTTNGLLGRPRSAMRNTILFIGLMTQNTSQTSGASRTTTTESSLTPPAARVQASSPSDSSRWTIRPFLRST